MDGIIIVNVSLGIGTININPDTSPEMRDLIKSLIEMAGNKPNATVAEPSSSPHAPS